MIAEEQIRMRFVPLVIVSGPSSVPTFDVLSLMVMIMSSTCVMGFRWLGCMRQNTVLPAYNARAHVSCSVN